MAAHDYSESVTRRFKTGLKPAEVQLGKVIGIGAYGKVYKAIYNGTPYAAKIIHDTLCYLPSDRSSGSHGLSEALDKFFKEIEFLERIRHPNIIQYISVYHDPAIAHSPVLLMELLECNLTVFLENRDTVISFEHQVNICQDVSRALAYLHSKDIVHRDLSGNNILIGKGIIAKLSDFGMAKLLNQGSRLSICPGAQVYMAPETVVERPDYTEKVDCFSFGVVIVQILTRHFPKPGERRKPVNIPNVSRTLEEVVSEVERRQNHIRLVKSGDPLLSIALKCLSDNPADRPSAKDLCNEIDELNVEEQKTLTSNTEPTQSSLCSDIERDYDIIGLEDYQHFSVSGDKSDQLKAESGEKKGVDIEETKPVTGVGATAAVELKYKVKSGDHAPREMCRHSNSVVDKDDVYILPAYTRTILAYSISIQKWSQLAICPFLGSSLAIVDNHLTTIGGKRVDTGLRHTVNRTAGYIGSCSDILWTHVKQQNEEEWIEKLPRMPTKRAYTTALTIESNLLVAGGERGDNSLNTIEILNIGTKEWMSSLETNLPQSMWAASATLCNGDVVVLGGRDNNGAGLHTAFSCSLECLLQYCQPKSIVARLSRVLPFNSPTFNVWNNIPDVPVALSTSAFVHGHLLAIGGKDTQGELSKNIYAFDHSSNKWRTLTDSNLSQPRSSCFVFSPPDDKPILYIVGGKASEDKLSNNVDIATFE